MKKISSLALLFLVPALAQAYVLSGPSVLRKAAEHRQALQLSSLVVHGELTLTGEPARAAAAALAIASPPEELRLKARVTYKLPGRCRIEVDAPATPNAAAASNVNGNLRSDGADLPVLRQFASLACPLLDQRGGEMGLVGVARGAGVELESVSLGRTNGVVAYVIGAHPKDASKPSLWIDKERLEPLRLTVAREGGVEQVNLIDYSSPATGEWHPRVVELRRGEALLGRFGAEKVEQNLKVSDAIF